MPKVVGTAPPSPSPRDPLPLRKALVGFTNAKFAEEVSQRTIDTYLDDLARWIERTGDREIGKVDVPEIGAYLAWPRTDYQRKNKTHGTKGNRGDWQPSYSLPETGVLAARQ